MRANSMATIDNLCSRLAATESVLAALRPTSSFEQVSAAECQRHLQMIKGIQHLEISMLADILAKVKGCGLSAQREALLLEALSTFALQPQSASDGAAAEEYQCKRAVAQHYEDAVYYVPSALWESLSSHGDTSELFGFLGRLGLRNPTEGSSQGICLLVLVATESLDKVQRMDHDSRAASVKVLKKMLQ